MTFAVVAYLRPGVRGARFDYQLVDDVAAAAAIFPAAELRWMGERIFDVEAASAVPDALAMPPPACEPGYALVAIRAEVSRPELHPHFTARSLIADARAWLAHPGRAIGMRVLDRRPPAEPAWPAAAYDLYTRSPDVFDDDHHRRVFADAIGGARGGFAIAQCDLARGGLTPAESATRRRAQRAALRRDLAAWSRLQGIVRRCRFRRGVVESIEVGYRARPEQLADAAPHARCLALPVSALRDGTLARWLALGPTGIALDGAQWLDRAGPIAELPLRAFGIDKLPGSAAADLRALRLVNLEVLRLPEHDLGPDDLAMIVERSPALRVLAIASRVAARSVLAAVPASVRELHVAGVPGEPLATLARVPCAGALEKLALRSFDLSDPAPLAAFTALRSLDLYSPDMDYAALARVPLPALRELRCRPRTQADARAIATAFGPQLELLDLRDVLGNVPEATRELRALVPGDVWMGRSKSREPLMVASYLPAEPMWDTGDVEIR